MSHSLYIGKEPNFQKIIIASVIIHVFFITLVAIPLKSKKREYKSYFVNIVSPLELRRAAKLASKSKVASSTKAPIKKKAAPRRRVKADSGVTLESANRVTKEIERLRALSALTKKKKDKELQLAKAQQTDEALSKAIENIRGKKLASISVGPGTSSQVSSVAKESYHALIIQQIQSNWVHSVFNSADLEAIISFRLDPEGAVTNDKIKIEKTSGNVLFDNSAVKAILKASPFPPHPVEKEIEVRFHL
jgi:TonB family protein